MRLRGALARVLLLVLVACSAVQAECAVQCAVGVAAPGGGSCHAQEMPGMAMDAKPARPAVSVRALPSGCVGHAAAIVQENVPIEQDGMPLLAATVDALRVGGGVHVIHASVRDVGSSGRLRVPMRV